MESRAEQNPGPGRWATIALGLAIAAVAIWLRFWRLSWGLPEQAGFADEVWIFNHYANAFTSLSWASFAQRSPLYPTLYGYLVGLTAVTLRAVGVLEGSLGPVTPAAFLAGRSVSASMGLLAVGLVGLAASRMYSRRVGIAAAALMAVTPFHVMYGHIASTDLTLSACVALTILCAYSAACSGRRWAVVGTGIAAGLAFATKYTGLAMLVLGAWVIGERLVVERSVRRALLGALAVGLGFLGAVVLACPPCVLTPGTMLEGMQTLYFQTTAAVHGLNNNSLTPTLGWYGRRYLFELVASLPFSLGWPLYAAALSGVAVAAWRRERGDRLLLVLVGSFFLSIGASKAVFPRYLMPLFPGLVILAARALLELRRPRWAGRALFAGVWLYSLVLTATQVARFSFDQQRGVAEWIAAFPREGPNEGPNRRVGFPETILDYFRLKQPLRANGLQPMQLREGHWFDDPPEFLVVPEWYEISMARDRPNSVAARDLARLRTGDAGYRPGPRWRSCYLQSDFYTRLDPAYAADLWQGEIGFIVYVRDRSSGDRRDRAPQTGAASSE
jgi:4-amino-4-deoxy-L-arabinose transferase-like glycosyltransferase